MPNKATVLCCGNQKGGGKTFTAENLGVGLAQEGKKVLLVDMDPQASLTISLGHPRPDELPVTISDMMQKVIMDEEIQPREGILTYPEGVDLMPASISLSGLEVSLVNAMSRESILKQYLEPLKKEYDFIILDCMPSLGMLTVNALAASDQLIVPVQAQYLSAKGLEQLLQTVNKVKRQINPKLRIEGILLTMVDSNLQREHILPSERAFAYKMKLEAMKHQGERKDLQGDLTSRQVGEKSQTSVETMSGEIGESQRQIQRYIRLTHLIPELLDLVDQKKISFNPAVELSYLKLTEQEMFLSVMDWSQNAPSLSQAQRLKKLSQDGKLTPDAMREIMNEVKKGDLERVTFRNETLRKYFPRSYTAQQMQDQIIKLLEQWQKRKQRDQER